MTDEFSYINEQGYTVLKSGYHRKRGSCCKSNCLHCPFGTTVNKLGFEFFDLDQSNLTEAQKILKDSSVADEFTSSLLSSAFGKKAQSREEITESNMENFKLLSLKSHICGVIKFDNKEILDFYLKEVFRDQGISLGPIQKSFV